MLHMLDIKTGDLFLVQQHDLENGQCLGSYVCVASISPNGPNNPEHAVLTIVDDSGHPSQSVRFFPPHYDHGKIPIVRTMPSNSPAFIESVAKITR